MHSADPQEMKAIVDGARELEVMRGSGIKMPAESEYGTRRNNRKSIVMERDVKAGECIGAQDVEIKRPGYGIQPKYLEQVIGRRAAHDLKSDDILRWEDLS